MRSTAGDGRGPCVRQKSRRELASRAPEENRENDALFIRPRADPDPREEELPREETAPPSPG